MPTISTTFAGLPVAAEYEWSGILQDYLLCDFTIADGLVDLGVDDLAIRRSSREIGGWVNSWFTLAEHLYQLVVENRAQWDADERRATRVK